MAGAPLRLRLDEHRLKLDEQLSSARTWARQAGLQNELGRADSTGGSQQEAPAGRAAAASVPIAARAIPTSLDKGIPGSPRQVAAIKSGIGAPVHMLSDYLATKTLMAGPNRSPPGGPRQLATTPHGP